MFSFKKSVIALVGIFVLIVVLTALLPLVSQGQGKSGKGPRRFYLTQTIANGGQPLTACADGYHMASLWEMHDPSNLEYETSLGFTKADSGFGPPTGSNARGWVRTGFEASTTAIAGQGNCNAWTVDVSSGDLAGTTVSFTFNWDDPAVAVSPWQSSLLACGSSARVWCVQD